MLTKTGFFQTSLGGSISAFPAKCIGLTDKRSSWLAVCTGHRPPAGVHLLGLQPWVVRGAGGGGGADRHVVLAEDVVLRQVHIIPGGLHFDRWISKMAATCFLTYQPARSGGSTLIVG